MKILYDIVSEQACVFNNEQLATDKKCNSFTLNQLLIIFFHISYTLYLPYNYRVLRIVYKLQKASAYFGPNSKSIIVN